MLGLRDFICELADREDDRIEPQKNHLVKARFFHGSKMRGGGKETKKKSIQSLQMSPRMVSLRQGNLLVSPPYSPSQVGGSSYLPKAGHYVCLQKWQDGGSSHRSRSSINSKLTLPGYAWNTAFPYVPSLGQQMLYGCPGPAITPRTLEPAAVIDRIQD